MKIHLPLIEIYLKLNRQLQGGAIVFSIKDFGRVIPKENHIKILERFFQVSE
jgi:signal transduction histidine kinase